MRKDCIVTAFGCLLVMTALPLSAWAAHTGEGSEHEEGTGHEHHQMMMEEIDLPGGEALPVHEPSPEMSPGMEHQDHGMDHGMGSMATTGSWSYGPRERIEPYAAGRWEMVPGPGGGVWIPTGGLDEAARCAALLGDPRTIVDRATKAACADAASMEPGGSGGQTAPMDHEHMDHGTMEMDHGAMEPLDLAAHEGGQMEHMGGVMDHWMASPEAAQWKNPIPATPSSIEQGEKIFRENCTVCHGASGRGDGPASAGLDIKPADLASMVPLHGDGELAWKITEGRGPMPPWGEWLSEEEIWDVVNFLRHRFAVDSGPGAESAQPAPPLDQANDLIPHTSGQGG